MDFHYRPYGGNAMIVWINGPYGVGKSTLAEKLHELDGGSFIFDAESVGNAVRDNLPPELFNGWIFENYPMWHKVCSELLADIAERFHGSIYVPMTLVERDSFGKIAQPLLDAGIDVKHILLTSRYDVIHDRILKRGEDEDCWCMRNIRLCLEKQAGFSDVVRVASAGRPVEELAAEILEYVRSVFPGFSSTQV